MVVSSLLLTSLYVSLPFPSLIRQREFPNHTVSGSAPKIGGRRVLASPPSISSLLLLFESRGHDSLRLNYLAVCSGHGRSLLKTSLYPARIEALSSFLHRLSFRPVAVVCLSLLPVFTVSVHCRFRFSAMNPFSSCTLFLFAGFNPL